jgi:hypothetical protein
MTNAGKKIELGEGRSKCIYIEPTVKDTAVLIAFFNPAGFKRILRNALYVIECLKNNKIPYFVIECVFNGAQPQIPNPTMVVHSNSYMFYKELLTNKLETAVPQEFTKLVCLDADIIFDSPDWLDQVSAKLDVDDIIQPFNQACWLTPNNTKIRSKKPSYAVGLVNRRLDDLRMIHMFHPGFAWAFKRETFRKIGGFFTKGIMGNGDTMFAFNFFKDGIPEFFINDLQIRFILDTWPDYHAKFKEVNPSVGFLNNKAFHLFHGVRQNRQYRTRYKSITHLITGTWDNEISLNNDGLFEFKNRELNAAFLEYFKARNEDIPLDEAERISSEPDGPRSRSTRRVRRGRRVHSTHKI